MYVMVDERHKKRRATHGRATAELQPGNYTATTPCGGPCLSLEYHSKQPLKPIAYRFPSHERRVAFASNSEPGVYSDVKQESSQSRGLLH